MDIQNVYDNYTGLLDANFVCTMLEAGADASSWYESATDDINAFADAFGFDRDTVAAVVAILSPRVQVSRNARLAVQYLLEGSTEGVMDQRVKAIERYIRYGYLNGDTHGKKVFAFYRNLSGDFDHVTIDTWMAKIYGIEFQGITNTEREDLQADVKAIADAAGITPAAAQAALWVGYRELQGHSDSEGALSIIDALEVN